jgi:hypothetical protein
MLYAYYFQVFTMFPFISLCMAMVSQFYHLKFVFIYCDIDLLLHAGVALYFYVVTL